METSARKKICIIAPEYMSCMPRTVKEADALWSAGFDVRVVFSQGNIAQARAFDQTLLSQKPWQTDIVGWAPFVQSERTLYYYSRVRVHALNAVPLLWPLKGAAERAEGRLFPELLRLARAQKADLYIGHYPVGLCVAAYAAKQWHVPYAYDIEDFHSEEADNTPAGRKRGRRIELLEKRFVRGCRYITASSEGIAEHFSRKYSVRKPYVVRNVFPFSERALMDGFVKDRRGCPLSLYWFSQVVGQDRGIQDVIRAAGLLSGAVEIHLRGFVSEKIKSYFYALARQNGVQDRLYFHDAVSPLELLSRTAEHDVGLALEQSHTLNRQLAAANKLFFYMTAGLAVAATHTSGQASIMNASPGAGFLYASGDYRALAAGLKRFIDEPEYLIACKNASLRAAQTLWNWETESRRVIEAVAGCL